MNSFQPATVAEASRLLAQMSRDRKRTQFVGAGTKIARAAVDTEIRTATLARLVEYAPADQVVSVEGGMPLRVLQDSLARERQRLALDPPFADRATVGGVIATASFGPRRMRYGAVRDLIIGVTLVRADGTIAKGGGKVVKNVAGFDLPKLMCGSHGTLGLIASATFRVHPLPEAQATMVARGLNSVGVFELLEKIRAAQIEPAAMLATRAGPDRWDAAVLFEGFEAGVKQQSARMRELASCDAGDPWADHLAAREQGETRVAALPSDLPRLEKELFSTLNARVSWYPSLGLGFYTSQEPQPPRAPPSLRLHRAVKARLDPDGLLPAPPWELSP